MDGVLVNIKNSWKYIHDFFQVDNNKNFDLYLKHKIDYKEFMKRDIDLWGNVHVKTLKNIFDKVHLMKGANATITQLKKIGCRTAIVSAGISILAQRIQRQLEIDYSFANKLLINKKGFLTGEGKEVVNPLKKNLIVNKILLKEKMKKEDCAVVGDSVFDVPMFKEAVVSIAFNSTNNSVKEAATVFIEEKDLREILPHIT
jgi:phosphoserine phosphatase